MPKTTEQKEAIAYYEWAQRIPILADLLFHIGNERECSVMKGHLLKLQGIKAGVVDYFLPLPRNGYHGFWLELKRDRTCRVTYLQQLWLDAMKKQGYATAVGYGAQHAIELTLEYLK